MKLLVHEKENNFDLIRIAMALLVVWPHSFQLYFGTEGKEPVSLLTNGLVNAGIVAFVDPAPFVSNPHHDLNGSLWSIPIEAKCYLGVLVFCLLAFQRTASSTGRSATRSFQQPGTVTFPMASTSTPIPFSSCSRRSPILAFQLSSVVHSRYRWRLAH